MLSGDLRDIIALYGGVLKSLGRRCFPSAFQNAFLGAENEQH